MHGVRVRWRSPDPRPWPGSDFARYFDVVLPRLRGLTWVVDDQGFGPPDSSDEAAWDTLDARRHWIGPPRDGPDAWSFNPYFLCDRAFVPDFAEWCDDDWNDLYGFDRPPADWRAWLRSRVQGSIGQRAAHLSGTVSVCFFAVDSAYWEFFAHDAGLVAEVIDAARGQPGLFTEPAVLGDSVGV